MMSGRRTLAASLLVLAASPTFAFASTRPTVTRLAAANRPPLVPSPPTHFLKGTRGLASRAAPFSRRSVATEGVGSAAAALALRGGEVGIGGPLSLMPPVLTLAVALATRQVAMALLVGIWSGAMLLNDLRPLASFLRCFDTHIVDAVSSNEHATVILFNLVLGGTIGLVQRGGGALGLASALKRFAKDSKSCLATSGILSSLIFFDDYASILIVGNSFRPLLPMLKLCKERFACIIHFVAVAVSASMPVSSWIGLQVGAASSATAAIRATGAALPDPFLLTMSTLPYRLFPLTLLALVVAMVVTEKDIGPMRAAVAKARGAGTGGAELAADSAAEKKAEAQPAGPLDPKPGTPLRAMNALLPFGAIIAGTLVGMVSDGKAALLANGVDAASISIVDCISSGDSVKALLWGSSLGLLSTLCLLLGQKILNLGEAMETMVNGMRDVIEPVIVLSLAWALGSIISAAGTADFIARGLTAGGLPVWALPAITSILSYAISFATGSSFGTIGILFPLIGPLAWTLSGGDLKVLTHCFGAVYGGSLFGNMFSPIADTSILTVLATRCELQAHVTTAAPYACLTGLLCLLLGDIPIGLGLIGPFAAMGLVTVAQVGTVNQWWLSTKEKSTASPSTARAPDSKRDFAA